ncbi:MAG: hypothetical protein AAF628_27260 [Planctomycetota bacterium]
MLPLPAGFCRVAAAGAALLTLALTGCEEAPARQELAAARTYVSVPRREIPIVETATRLGYDRPAPAAAPLTYELPAGWVERPASEFRDVNLAIPGGGECYVTMLSGGGGRVAGNVNRWRGQLGLAPASAADVAALPRRPLLGGEAVYLEIDGELRGAAESRLVGLLLDRGPDAISVKMTGPRELLEGEAERFAQFCASLALRNREAGASGEARGAAPGAAATKASPPSAGARSMAGDFAVAWQVPEGWQPGRTSTMRLGTFHPDGDADIECVVFHFARPSGGNEIENVERWLRQMGQSLPAGGLEALPTIQALGNTWRLVKAHGSFTGMAGQSVEDQGMLAVFSEVPGHVVCVKMTGPAAKVNAHEARFVAFVQSLQRG